jgi:DNA transformation protein
MAQTNKYLEFLLEWLGPLGEITTRSMFGGHTLYCDDVVFALVARSALYLKVDDLTRAGFESRGLKPFQPFEDKPGVMQFYPPPAEFFDDPDVMADWGRAAVEVGRRGKTKKKKIRK